MELIDIAANPCPPGGNIVGLRAADGVELRAAFWRPEGIPRGTVALVHGRAEFIEKYFETIGELLSRGFVVATFDWRGQGLSTRLLRKRAKGHVRRAADYRLDLDAFVRQLLAPDCPRPWFALAHSMGAAAALDQAAAGRSPFARIVGIAPMLGLHGFAGSKLARALVGVLHGAGLGRLSVPGRGRETLAQLPFADNILTGDERRFNRAKQVVTLAPSLAIGGPTIAWTYAAYRLIDRLNAPGVAEKIKIPTLFLAGSGEKLVDNASMERFVARMKNADCIVLSGARHEILMERAEARAKFWAAFDAFIPGEAFLLKAAEAAGE